ncbi:acetylornithine/N-succinyldiaminopimelate aminotransferase [Rhodoligotrophos appendicifer]|uniref:aspartate aminotransferase family protein n=1 Tax=Rhodoligotrophos appendicifer TaxID=987056 RepID=UPI00117EB2F3|nr:aspartate aminotransferase family protein [Rhodoligotrophos appendicifer]
MVAAVLPTYARMPVAFDRGVGAHLFTAEGESYLDFGSGIAVNALGHAHPHLVQALKDQAEKLWHTSNIFEIPGQQRLAERLIAASFADTVFFCNSGAEAIECAVKMARRYHWAKGAPERYRIVTIEGAFHGRTLATIAAGGQQKHLEGFGPPVEGFDQVAFGDIAAIKAAIGPETAGVLIEPILGEGGLRVWPHSSLRALRALCDEEGILLLCDEVQCGMGRTGKLFAHEWAGIIPDIVAVAKGLGGGFPVGACLATENAASGMVAGTHGSTFGGNPLAMAIGNAVLDIILADGFLERVQHASKLFSQKLAQVQDEHPDIIEEVRGEGLMRAVKCKVPNKDLLEACLQEHLLTVGGGDNVLRLLPPLIIKDEEIEDGVRRLSRACTALARGNGVAT